MIIVKLPDVQVRCEFCSYHKPESCFYDADMVFWNDYSQVWVCKLCWDEASCLDIGEKAPYPWLVASDLLTDTREQRERMIAAAAKRRLGMDRV
jgi:hypothetical protein